MATSVAGPRLDDSTFFTEVVDTSRPGLEELPAAVSGGDLAAARRRFAEEVRRTLQPERFLRIRRAFLDGTYLRPGETAAEAAERVLRLELISCGTPWQFEGQVDWFANPTFNQYREWTWQLNRHQEWAILGQRYRETGDERYAQGFVELFRSWVRQAVVPPDALEAAPDPAFQPLTAPNETKAWRTIETGIRMGGSWQWALHSFVTSPAFTDDVLVDWYKSVWEHGRRLRYAHRVSGNWLIMEMNGLAQSGLLYPQFRDAAAWKSYALDRLVAELDHQVYPDGFQYELTTGYHQVNIRNYQWLWDVYEAYDEPVPDAFRAGLERMHDVNVRLMMPDGRLPDVNDGRWHETATLLERAVELYPQRDDYRWARTRGREGTPPAERSAAFPYAGYYAMRTGWESDAVWALFDGGPFGQGHQHEDKLNVLLHAYGRLLLTEGGNYAYDASEMRRYVLSTRAHNTVRVDGRDQNRRARFRKEDVDVTAPAGARWVTTDAYDLAEAVYDEGYGDDLLAVVHRRTVVLSRQTPGPFLLVVDRLSPPDDAPHRYEVLWHLDAEAAERDGLAVHGRDAGEPNLSVLPAAVAGLEVDVVAGQETPEWQGWKATSHSQQGQYTPAPTAVATWEVTGPARLVTLLFPTRADAACPVTAVEASPDPAATTVRLVLADGGHLDLDEADLPGSLA